MPPGESAPAAETAAAPPPSGKSALGGGLVMVIALGLVGGGVFLGMRGFGKERGNVPVITGYREVDLGSFPRELGTGEGVNTAPEFFVVQVVLILNPVYDEVEGLGEKLEKRSNLLKHIVATEIINRKSEMELRQANILDTLSVEIKRRINTELNAGKDGQELVDKVIFPESRLPARR